MEWLICQNPHDHKIKISIEALYPNLANSSIFYYSRFGAKIT